MAVVSATSASGSSLGILAPSFLPTFLATATSLFGASFVARPNSKEPAQATSDYQRFGSGEKVLAIEDQSIEAASSMRTLGHIRWEARRVDLRAKPDFTTWGPPNYWNMGGGVTPRNS